MTSLKMKKLIPQRNEVSTFRLKRWCSDSPITVPNQPKNMTSSTQKPKSTTQGPGE